MKELRNRHGVTTRGLLAAAVVCLLGGEAAAQTQTFAKPGDTGTIEFPLANDSTSGIDATSVQLAARIVPATLADRFQVNSVTIKEDGSAQPTTIAVGQTRTFVVNYTITSAAQDGDSFQVFLDATLPDEMVLPDPSTWGTVVDFTIAPTPPSLSCSGPGPQWNSPSVITCKASASGGTVTLPGTVTYRSPDGSQVTSQITVAGAGCQNYPVTATASSGLSTTVTVPVVNNTISLNPPVYTLTPSNSSVFVGVYASNCDTVPHSVYLYNPAYSAQSQPGILLPWLTGLTNFNGEYQDVVPPSSSNALVDGLAFGYYFDGPLPASGATGNKFPYALVPENHPVDNPAPLLASNVLPADAMNGEVDEDPAPHPDDTLTLTTPQFPDPWPVDTNSSIGVLFSGYGDGLGHLLGGLGVTSTPVLSNLAMIQPGRPLTGLKTLFVGSGGSASLSGSPSATAALAAFVSGGGTLVVMTQPQAASFGFIPRAGEFSFVGWQNGQLSTTSSNVSGPCVHRRLSPRGSDPAFFPLITANACKASPIFTHHGRASNNSNGSRQKKRNNAPGNETTLIFDTGGTA